MKVLNKQFRAFYSTKSLGTQAPFISLLYYPWVTRSLWSSVVAIIAVSQATRRRQER